MKYIKLDSSSFGNYKSKLAGLLKQPNLMGVFSKGCGHCTAMEPAWNELKSRLSNEKCGAGIMEIDSEVVPHIQNPAIRGKINGYPTIMIIKNGRPAKEYAGDRNVDDLYSFCKENLIDNENGTKSRKRKNTNQNSMQDKKSRRKRKFLKRFKMKGGSKKKRKIKKGKKHKRHQTKKQRNKRELAGAPNTPIARDGTLNPFWVKNIDSESHVSYKVDPGSGTYSHITYNPRNSNVTYRYGVEGETRLHDGIHYWTTPPNQPISDNIRHHIKKLYDRHSEE